MNEQKTAVLMDSGGDLPYELCVEEGIYYLPLHVIYPEKDYQDGIDIDPLMIYRRFPDEIPTTSTPSPGEITDMFDRIREDVLARYEQDCRKVMTPEQDQQYGQVYHRLTKQAEYMDRLQKSFAENRPEAYEAEAAAIRKDNGQDAALAGDVAENCVKNFEENLSGDRKKILEEYRAEMRRQQELRDKTQDRLSEAAGRSMREYCDEEERIRAAAQEPEKEIDKAILTEETAKAYDANIRNKGRENEYADEQNIRKETAEYLESAKRNSGRTSAPIRARRNLRRGSWTAGLPFRGAMRRMTGSGRRSSTGTRKRSRVAGRRNTMMRITG